MHVVQAVQAFLLATAGMQQQSFAQLLLGDPDYSKGTLVDVSRSSGGSFARVDAVTMAEFPAMPSDVPTSGLEVMPKSGASESTVVRFRTRTTQQSIGWYRFRGFIAAGDGYDGGVQPITMKVLLENGDVVPNSEHALKLRRARDEWLHYDE
jgi:hypothetical protein